MRSFASWVFVLALTSTATADDWPQWMGPHRDAVWAESGICDRFPPQVL